MNQWMSCAFVLLCLLIFVRPVPIAEPNAPRLNPERMGGHYQGDMVLPPKSSERSAGSRPTFQRWARGVVPYEFDSNFSVDNSIFIVDMMREMETLTMVNNTRCISFREKNASDPYFITIFNGSGCYAPVGSWGTEDTVREVSLMDSPTATCMISGIIQHELTHVLGFYHEQSRPDRDTYVSIQWSNIEPENAYNFEKYNDTEVDTLMTSYDYGSVMHYERDAFAINDTFPTIIPLLNSSAFLGQRIRLSPSDILGIQRYYGCVPMPTRPNVTTSRSGALPQLRQTSWMVPVIWILSMQHIF